MAGWNANQGDPIGTNIANAANINPNSDGGRAFGTAQNFVNPVGGGLFGDSNSPGLLGTGRYQVNPSAFAPTSTGADTMFGNAAGAAGRGATQLNGADQMAARDQQSQLIQMLMAQANGTGPSVAQQQLNQATDRNVQQTMAVMASQRGAGAGASAYQAANAGGQAGQQMAADSATLRLQEQQQAQGMLGNTLNGQRGQDIQFAGANAQLGAQQKQMNDQMVQFYTSQGMSIEQANRQAQIDLEKQQQASYYGQAGGGSGGGGGSGLAAVGSIISAFSDERLKTEIKDADGEIESFLDALTAHSYEYKNPGHGAGRRISVMAQELEKSRLGKEFVFETPDGKAVDYGKGFGTMLAAQAALHKRLKALED